MPYAQPGELSHEEGIRLLDQIATFGQPLPHLVLTGGDPMERPRLMELIACARQLGIKVSVTPAATPKLTLKALQELKDAGVESLAFSLDGSSPERHDSIRQVPGCFDLTVQGVKWALQVGLPVQINTLICEETVDDLPAVYELLQGMGLMRWSLFFLISVGRGKQLKELDSQRAETLMNWVYDLAQVAAFQIKTTEAPSYRRIAHERAIASAARASRGTPPGVQRGYGIRDGNGIVFVAHDGAVYPSGFLPLEAGNVRLQNLVRIYRETSVFQNVRDVDHFDGKCGFCEFRRICGGSRARTFAHTGDPAGSDPLCVYQPRADVREFAPTV